MMNRRAFFSAIAAVAATAVIDPERALWVPGKKKIFIPPPRGPLLLLPYQKVLFHREALALISPAARRCGKSMAVRSYIEYAHLRGWSVYSVSG